MNGTNICNIFLSRANLDRVCRGTDPKIVRTYMPGYVKFIKADSPSRRGTIGELLDFYNRGFTKLLYDATLALDDKLDVDVGHTHTGNYNKTPDELLESWKFNAARQPQFREDPVASVSTNISSDAMHIGDDTDPIWSEAELIDRTYGRAQQPQSFDRMTAGQQSRRSTANFEQVETADADIDAIFHTPAMKRMNAGMGYSMSADDPNSALRMQERIWGSADATQTRLIASEIPQWGSASGVDDESSYEMYSGVRSEVRYRDTKNHHRQYDRGNDGLGRGQELDNFSGGFNMSTLRQRKPYRKN